MIKWYVKKMKHSKQKELLRVLATELLDSSKSGIDNFLAEDLLTAIIKSKHNRVTKFIIKD